MEISKGQLSALIDYLQGTCKSLADGCEFLGFKYDDLTMEQLEELDSHLFQCDSCGWWYETGEMSDLAEDENICTDCEYLVGEDPEDLEEKSWDED